MKNSSQESIRHLFNLDPNENIYDDFGCSMFDTIVFHGRLFITENNICFNSNILGFKKKIVIPMSTIVKIETKKVLGVIDNSIQIFSKNERNPNSEKSFVFFSFSNRDISYKRINSIYRAYKKLNNYKIQSDSDDDSIDLVANSVRKGSAFNLPKIDIEKNQEEESENKSEVYFEPVDPDKYWDLCKLVISISASDFLQRILADNGELSFDKFYVENMGHMNVSKTNWTPLNIENKLDQSVLFEKPDNFDSSSVNQNKDLNRISNISDTRMSNLKEPSKVNASLDNEVPFSSKIINSPIENVINSSENMNEIDLNNKNEAANINENNSVNNLNLLSNNPNQNGFDPMKLSMSDLLPNKVFVRTINFTIKVKDVPFVNQTRVIKTQKLKREGEKILYSTCTQSLDVPYCTYFTNEDIWEIIPKENDKCILRICCYVNFNKSTVFRAKIEKKSKEECIREFHIWTEELNKRGIKSEAYNPNKIKKKEEKALEHGVQKSEIPNKNQFSIIKKAKRIFNFANDLRINNPIQFYLYAYLTIVIFILLGIILRLNLLNNKYEIIIENQNKNFEILKNFIMNNTQNYSLEGPTCKS